MSTLLTYNLPVPAIAGQFGRRLRTFQTQVRPDQVVNLLGHDPRSKYWNRLPEDLKKMYEYLQRKTTKSRREGTAEYIDERIASDQFAIGAFPAISIGMTKPQRFVNDPKQPAVGVLEVELSGTNRRVLLDGLARVTGGLDLIDQGRVELGQIFTFPVTIYTPADDSLLSLEELGQLFHDFNFLQTSVTATQAIALDQSDIYVQLTNAIGESPTFKKWGGMERKAASLGAKSTAIVVQRVLLRTVRGACEGRRMQESDSTRVANANLTRETFNQLRGEITSFFGELASRMGEDRWKDRESLHLTAPGWQVMGLIFYDIKYNVREPLDANARSKVLDRLARLDWSRYNPDWIPMLGEPERDEQGNVILKDGRQKVALSRAGRTTIAALRNHVRKECGIDLLIKDDQGDSSEQEDDGWENPATAA